MYSTQTQCQSLKFDTPRMESQVLPDRLDILFEVKDCQIFVGVSALFISTPIIQ